MFILFPADTLVPMLTVKEIMPETLWAAVETVSDTKKRVSYHCYVKIDAYEPYSLIFCKAGWWSCVYCAQLRNDSRSVSGESRRGKLRMQT